MNFFHQLHKSKLDAMRAAAPRATPHLLHESNGFSAYLSEAAAAQKVCPQIGTITNHAEDDILDEPVLHLFIPMEQMVRFVEEVTASQSVALVDVILADRVHAARYAQYAHFPKQRSYPEAVGTFQHDATKTEKYPTPTQEEYDRLVKRCYRMSQAEIDEEGRKSAPVEKIGDDPDFWG